MKRFILPGIIITVFISWTFQGIELEKKNIFNNKVEILIPKYFQLMPEDMLKLKYPSQNRPTFVYTDEDGTVNIAFNHTPSKASQSQIVTYKDYFISTFKKSFPTAEWEANGIKEINGRKVGYLGVTTPAIDTNVYNLLFFTDFEGKLLICSFNCTVEKKSEWLETANSILNSISIK